MRIRATILLLVLFAASQAVEFSVTIADGLLQTPFTGHVVVYFSTMRSEPRFGPNWFNPQPAFSQKFKNIGPNEPMVIGKDAVGGVPGSMRDLKAGEYTVQAVVDLNLGGRSIGESPGNLYSVPKRVYVDPASDSTINIECTKTVADKLFKDTAVAKAARMQSKLLSAFYGRPANMRAAVILPESYDKEPSRKYPVIYSIPGFGGSFLDHSGTLQREGTSRDGVEFIEVILDPNCPTGHCVFANSANNGPWGKALVTEFIPYIEKTFRAVGKPEGRFTRGHSSGGWSSLWLQVAYPDFFGGCWSTSPDPVDFRDFQRIDLYKQGQNMFRDEEGKPRPLARFGDTPAIFYQQFSDMERPIRGEQLGSFEAVFSPRGEDGEPMKLWNRTTGAVDNAVALSWQKYDIDLVLRKNWKVLGPKLAGKLHVYMGNMDTFYLDGAVRLLQKDLKDLGSDAVVEMLPGDHATVMTHELEQRIDREMAAKWRASKDE